VTVNTGLHRANVSMNTQAEKLSSALIFCVMPITVVRNSR